MSHSLGTATFTFFRRDDQRGKGPDVLTEQKTILQRRGVDGVSVRHEGRKGMPFRMHSFRDVETIEAGYFELDRYKTMEDAATPHILIWNDVNYFTSFSLKYIVLRAALDYDILRVRSVVGAARVTTTPAYIVKASWDLIAVHVDPPVEE